MMPEDSEPPVRVTRVVHVQRATVAQLEICFRHPPPSLRAVKGGGTPIIQSGDEIYTMSAK